MTTNESLYQAVLDILRKDIRGEAVSVAEFNAILPVVSHEYYAQQYAKFQQTQNITDSLAPFIATGTVALTAGVGSLPYTSTGQYFHLIGSPTYTETVALVAYTRKIDMVTRLEYAERAVDPITLPSTTYPVAILGVADKAGSIGTWADGGYVGTLSSFLSATGMTSASTGKVGIYFAEDHGLATGDLITISNGRNGNTGAAVTTYNGTHRVVTYGAQYVWLPDVTYASLPDFAQYTVANRPTITVYPTTITSISVTYLKKPVTPKLDYYVTDATNVRTFLGAQQIHTVVTGETFPVSTITPSDSYTSETVEMEWLPQDRPSILYLILKKLGVTMENPNAFQFASQEQQINNRA